MTRRELVNTGMVRRQLGIALFAIAASGAPMTERPNRDIPEAVRDGEAETPVSEGDATLLAAAKATILTNKELRLQLHANARSFVQKEFDLLRKTAKPKAVYQLTFDQARPYSEGYVGG